MDTWIAKALVDLGEAGDIMITFWTDTGEAIDAVDTGAAIVAGVAGALINVDVTHGPCKKYKDS